MRSLSDAWCSEATDHFTQSEVDQMNVALQNAQNLTGKKSSESSGPSGAPAGTRGFGGGIGGGGGGGADFISLVAQLPGIGGNFAKQARDLQAISEAQERDNARAYGGDLSRADATNPNVVPGMSPSFDPVKVAKQIYPILEFRDKIVKAISTTISKIPGLEKLLDHIAETLTAFILGLLAPFVR